MLFIFISKINLSKHNIWSCYSENMKRTNSKALFHNEYFIPILFKSFIFITTNQNAFIPQPDSNNTPQPFHPSIHKLFLWQHQKSFVIHLSAFV